MVPLDDFQQKSTPAWEKKKKQCECIIRYIRHIVQTYVQKAGTLVFPHAETIWAARPGILVAQEIF